MEVSGQLHPSEKGPQYPPKGRVDINIIGYFALLICNGMSQRHLSPIYTNIKPSYNSGSTNFPKI